MKQSDDRESRYFGWLLGELGKARITDMAEHLQREANALAHDACLRLLEGDTEGAMKVAASRGMLTVLLAECNAELERRRKRLERVDAAVNVSLS